MTSINSIPALFFDKISCTFISKENYTQRYTAVADTTLSIAPGEFVSIVGPTGCGKSTLLNVGAGLLQPSSGSVKIFGEELTGINRRAGYMFQSEALMPWRNTLQNVIAGLQYRKMDEYPARQLGEEWLERVGLQGFSDHYPHQLSGGMRKRVALAQTLVLDPDIILMDEPFSALDIQTRQLMENEVLALWSKKKKAVLFITHDLDEAIAMSDRVIVLSAGPATHPIGEFVIDLPRPRDVAEIRTFPRFVELHRKLWDVLRDEVSVTRKLILIFTANRGAHNSPSARAAAPSPEPGIKTAACLNHLSFEMASLRRAPGGGLGAAGFRAWPGSLGRCRRGWRDSPSCPLPTVRHLNNVRAADTKPRNFRLAHE